MGRGMGDNDGNDIKIWNPTAMIKLTYYPKHQHLEFFRLFDTHRMLLHYFLSTKGPYNTNVNDIKDVIENIFLEEAKKEDKPNEHDERKNAQKNIN